MPSSLQWHYDNQLVAPAWLWSFLAMVIAACLLVFPRQRNSSSQTLPELRKLLHAPCTVPDVCQHPVKTHASIPSCSPLAVATMATIATSALCKGGLCCRGTAAWAAPEQLREACSAAADVWAVGKVLMYLLLHGDNPLLPVDAGVILGWANVSTPLLHLASKLS